MNGVNRLLHSQLLLPDVLISSASYSSYSEYSTATHNPAASLQQCTRRYIVGSFTIPILDLKQRTTAVPVVGTKRMWPILFRPSTMDCLVIHIPRGTAVFLCPFYPSLWKALLFATLQFCSAFCKLGPNPMHFQRLLEYFDFPPQPLVVCLVRSPSCTICPSEWQSFPAPT